MSTKNYEKYHKSKKLRGFSLVLLAFAAGCGGQPGNELTDTNQAEAAALVARQGGVRFNSCDSLRPLAAGESFRLVKVSLKDALGVTSENHTLYRANGELIRLNVIVNFIGNSKSETTSCRIIFGAGGARNLERIGQDLYVFLPTYMTDTDFSYNLRVQYYEKPGQQVVYRTSGNMPELGDAFAPWFSNPGSSFEYSAGRSLVDGRNRIIVTVRGNEDGLCQTREECIDRQNYDTCQASGGYGYGKLTSGFGPHNFCDPNKNDCYFLQDPTFFVTKTQVFQESPMFLYDVVDGTADGSQFARFFADKEAAEVTGTFGLSKSACVYVSGNPGLKQRPGSTLPADQHRSLAITSI